MSTARTNSPAVIVKSVTATHSGKSLAAKIMAPDVAGYTFVCWTGCATHGNVGTPYIESPDSRSTNVWDAAKTPSATIYATALYRLSSKGRTHVQQERERERAPSMP